MMRANGHFDEVRASQGGGGMLPAGGYAAQIHEVIDGTEEATPYLGLVLNVLDPQTKRMRDTQDLADPERWWRHTYRYFVSSWGGEPGIDWARYKALTDAVEQTAQNNGFRYQDVDGGERQLVGKWMGVVMRHYLYVPQRGKNAGQQREGVELAYVLPAADAIAGNFDQGLAATRDGRPDGLKGTPFPPEPTVVRAPAPSPAATPASAAPAPPLYDEDVPF